MRHTSSNGDSHIWGYSFVALKFEVNRQSATCRNNWLFLCTYLYMFSMPLWCFPWLCARQYHPQPCSHRYASLTWVISVDQFPTDNHHHLRVPPKVWYVTFWKGFETIFFAKFQFLPWTKCIKITAEKVILATSLEDIGAGAARGYITTSHNANSAAARHTW